ncbi:MAG: prepilin-type N-terminal cleavage/methylation domain-containing protein [Proteobacteria bacterium]|nr:prepilin-type N-terminal cleavage/methylation domain-containing protein [Pseudomonadota bacterium]
MKKIHAFGFTLIELMVTVVIIGILAGIAYPSYTKYMIQTRRSDAQIALSQAANQQERFFTYCNNHYAQNLNGVLPPVCATNAAFSNGSLAFNNSAGATVLSPSGHYVITLTAPTLSGAVPGGTCPITSCYELIADPNAAGASGRQAGDGKFKINSMGIKTWDKKNDGSYSAKWTDN